MGENYKAEQRVEGTEVDVVEWGGVVFLKRLFSPVKAAYCGEG
jgi:hypothetical protein